MNKNSTQFLGAGRARNSLLAVLAFWLFASNLAYAVDDPVDLGASRATYQHIEQLLDARANVPSWQLDGLNRRIDQLGIQFVSKLNDAAKQLLLADTIESKTRAELAKLFELALQLAESRLEELEQRAAEERGFFDKFEQSAQSDISRAFIEDLLQIREDYLAAIVAQLDIRQSLGLPVEVSTDRVRQRVILFIERLTGQILLDAMSVDGLERRLIDNAMDENLQAALGLVKAKQSRNLEALAGMIDVAAKVGIDTTEQRGLLIREQGKITVDILKGPVFGTLFRQAIDDLSQTVRRSGPDVLLRSLVFAFILLAAWIVSRLARYPLSWFLSRQSIKTSALLRPVLVSIFSGIILLAGLIIALASVGVTLGPMLAGLGVAGIIVGLALQNSLGNLAAGAMILLDRPFDVDDYVNVNGAEGIVKQMNLVATTITTFDNQSVRIPNDRIWGNTIVNFTANKVRRVDIKVNFSYAEDPDRVRTVLLDLLEKHDNVLEKPSPMVHLSAMEDSSVAMMVKPWVRTADYWTTLWDLTYLIKKRFDAEGIEIPFPQRVVTLVPANGAGVVNDTRPDSGETA